MFGKLIKLFSGGNNSGKVSYADELEKFEQTYLITLGHILDACSTEKITKWVSDAHEVGKLLTYNNKISPETQKALEFVKNNFDNIPRHRDMYLFSFKNQEDKDKELLGYKFYYLQSSVLEERQYNSKKEYIGDAQNFLDLFEDLNSKAKVISEKPIWYRFACYFLTCLENIHKDLKELVNIYNINIDRTEILKTNRPFLDEINTINLTEFAIPDFEKYNQLVNKSENIISSSFNKIEERLFPDSEVIMHSNVVSGLASPYDVMKKLIVDLILILDIVLVKSSSKADNIQELIKDLSLSEWTVNLLSIYIRIGYPLPLNLEKHKKGWKEKYGVLIAKKSVNAIIKQTAPFIIGKEYEHPDVKEGLKHPFHTEHKHNSTTNYFTVN